MPIRVSLCATGHPGTKKKPRKRAKAYGADRHAHIEHSIIGAYRACFGRAENDAWLSVLSSLRHCDPGRVTTAATSAQTCSWATSHPAGKPAHACRAECRPFPRG